MIAVLAVIRTTGLPAGQVAIFNKSQHRIRREAAQTPFLCLIRGQDCKVHLFTPVEAQTK